MWKERDALERQVSGLESKMEEANQQLAAEEQQQAALRAELAQYEAARNAQASIAGNSEVSAQVDLAKVNFAAYEQAGPAPATVGRPQLLP